MTLFFFIPRLFVMTRRLRTLAYVTGVADSIVLLLYNGPTQAPPVPCLPYLMRAARPLLFSHTPPSPPQRLSFPLPDSVPMGRGIAAAKGCWGYPGGRGKNLLWERVGGLYLTPLL